MGSGETGGSAALPIWIGYMQTALKDVPETFQSAPEGLTSVDVVNTRKGGGTAKEFFYSENVPAEIPAETPDSGSKPVD
jgi:penicillin-binding protein 1A